MTKKNKTIVVTIILAVSLGILTGCSLKSNTDTPRQYQTVYYDIFDTVTTIIGYAGSQEEFEQNAAGIYEQLKQYHQWFDIYHEYGENNLKTINDNAGKHPVKVNKEIMALLLDCEKYYEKTGGKVNVAMGSVLSLWHEARSKAELEETEQKKSALLPSEAKLQEAGCHISPDTLIVDEADQTVWLEDAGQSLDVGAIAKGWAVERVCENAPKGYLISVGGNVCATGAKPDGSPWKIGIQDPDNVSSYADTLELTKGSVVTSGDYQRYVEIAGEKYHHLIDPDTLYPAKYWKSVTVVCEDSGAADALSTALFLMTKEEGEVLLKEYEASALWIGEDGSIVYSDN